MAHTWPADAFPVPRHNHGRCQSAALKRAQRLFEAKGMKLTELRRRVLEEISASHEALGAYDILERLAAKGRRLAPISVYRAIDALLEAGAVHRLESRNAFFACHSAHDPERNQLILACERCGQVAEIEGGKVFAAIADAVEAAAFLPARTVAEVSGVCAACRGGP